MSGVESGSPNEVGRAVDLEIELGSGRVEDFKSGVHDLRADSVSRENRDGVWHAPLVGWRVEMLNPKF